MNKNGEQTRPKNTGILEYRTGIYYGGGAEFRCAIRLEHGGAGA
jgi:hypothetical protein